MIDLFRALQLFGAAEDVVEKYECEDCKYGDPAKHNGTYVKIMDWQTKKPLKFANLLDRAK